ncbi:ArsR/SmtB family transcription factor [Deinococcus aestuarii]|uniref:ArsR/SmtB family transcription factor n=1 Tax=Deinococcus aestuarii TaxID=2774531 RepID=UPI001C0B767E|nr:DUF5937 family protein [Deinococcus aestuarii]
MIALTLAARDLTQLRFAFSPLWEVVASLRTLRAPPSRAIHAAWARRAREVVSPADLPHLFALVPPQGYAPNFLTPPPSTPFPEVAAELAVLRATPPDLVVAEVREALAAHPTPDAARLAPYLTRPEASLAALADVLERYWEAALAPEWPRLRRVLERDVQFRARTLALYGPETLFAELHPLTRYRDGVLTVGLDHWEWRGSAAGRGLLLLPSVFAWPDLYVTVEAPWQPTVAYSAWGSANLWWDEPPGAPQVARVVMGERRAALLSLLCVPLTTQELARRLGLTPSAVSQQVGTLRAVGLVTSSRSGRYVWHQLSVRGLQVLTALSDEG